MSEKSFELPDVEVGETFHDTFLDTVAKIKHIKGNEIYFVYYHPKPVVMTASELQDKLEKQELRKSVFTPEEMIKRAINGGEENGEK